MICTCLLIGASSEFENGLSKNQLDVPYFPLLVIHVCVSDVSNKESEHSQRTIQSMFFSTIEDKEHPQNVLCQEYVDKAGTIRGTGEFKFLVSLQNLFDYLIV